MKLLTFLILVVSVFSLKRLKNRDGYSKTIIKPGEAKTPPIVGDIVSVNYVGKKDGKEFASSKPGEPFAFTIKAFTKEEEKEMNCWDKVIPTMNFGEKATVVCTKNMNNVLKLTPGVTVPIDSDLTFDIEYVSKE